MTNEEFIRLHHHDDIRRLALSKTPKEIDLRHCLEQIEGWQIASRKIPSWAEKPDILYPKKISLEQCSSQSTAIYKKQLAERLLPDITQRETFTDLTGGMGVDFSFLAQAFHHSTYIEQQEYLCQLARHNMPILGLTHVHIICGPAADQIEKKPSSLIFLDPARRDNNGKKVFLLEDCTPDVTQLQVRLMEAAPVVMIKLSPMLDIAQAQKSLKHICEVHVLSVQGECKELLLILKRTSEEEGLTYHCAHIGSETVTFRCTEAERNEAPEILSGDTALTGAILHEPVSCILKAGTQDALANQCGIRKLHSLSNLFISTTPLSQPFQRLFRSFRITMEGDFSKDSLKRLTSELTQANLTIRNFPSDANSLRKRLKLKEGGNIYLFATTRADGRHVLLRCEK